MKKLVYVALPLLAVTPAFAEESKRQMEAHVHGVSALQIAAEGTRVEAELTAPGADIVGFEHVASNDADKTTVEAALETLSDPANVLTFPDAAGCKPVEAEVELHGEDEHHEEGHDDHDDHADENDHDDHDDHAEESGARHNEFSAHYVFDCADPAALTEIALPFFDSFKNAKEIEAEYVLGDLAGAFEVTRDRATLSLK